MKESVFLCLIIFSQAILNESSIMLPSYEFIIVCVSLQRTCKLNPTQETKINILI